MELLDALRARMATDQAKRLYKLRSRTVELIYADLKEHRGLRASIAAVGTAPKRKWVRWFSPTTCFSFKNSIAQIARTAPRRRPRKRRALPK